MKFSISRDIFLEALQKVQNVVEKKNTVQVLSNILLETTSSGLVITATDLEVGISVTVPIGDAQLSPGKIALAAKSLVDITRELPNSLVTLIQKENNWVEISCEKSVFNLVGLAAHEFPSLPAFKSEHYATISAAHFREMVDTTLFASSTDETRYQLNGVLLESVGDGMMRMVATDGHRLSFTDRELMLQAQDEFRDGVMIPKKGLIELRRLLDGKTESFGLAFDKSNLLVKLNDADLFIRLIEGEYPDYEQVIPRKSSKRLIANREAFLHSLRRVALLANEKSRGVRFAFAKNLLTISSSNPDLGEAKEELDCDYTSEPVEIGFNAKYIIDCLSILECEFVTFDFSDKLSAGILRKSGKDDYTYVVMPMRI